MQKEIAMNEKASVSKELNDRHAKILLGLVKLPENKECADCGSKAPRWASINLGVFICLQCSGIHRSLGVHISKVRSTTLDTWLPEQISFMQLMGNEKANEYWEAKLPPNFDRNPMEKFIYSKYVEKKWASTSLPQPMPEKSFLDKSVSTSVTIKGIPKKARKYSLGEEFFAKEVPQIPPPMSRSRAGSFDLRSDPIVPLPVATQDDTNVERDLFSLLYVTEEKDRAVVPPSRWATFECACMSIESRLLECRILLLRDGSRISDQGSKLNERMHQTEICFISKISSPQCTLQFIRRYIRRVNPTRTALLIST